MRILNSGYLLLITMTGCAAPPFIPDTHLDPTNSATIIIYTPDTAFNQQNFIKPVIFVDGKKLGQVSIKEPLTAKLGSGLHKISFQRSFFFMPMYESGSIDINTTPPEIYYVRYSFDFDDRAPLDNTPSASGASSFRLTDKISGEKRQ